MRELVRDLQSLNCEDVRTFIQSGNAVFQYSRKSTASLGAKIAKKIEDRRGNLTFVEGNNHIPFDVKRVYYLYDVPGGADRGEHAHKDLHQFVISMSGSFDLLLDDGFKHQRFQLNRPYYGISVCPRMWRYLDNFSSGSVCMVLASNRYDEEDYYRDYNDFLKAKDREG